MSDVSIEALMAELESDDTPETPEADAETPEPEKVEEPVAEEVVPEPEKTAEVESEDPLEGLIVGATEEPKPSPKKRGRPKGSTNAKKKAEAVVEAVVEEVTTSETDVDDTPMALAFEQIIVTPTPQPVNTNTATVSTPKVTSKKDTADSVGSKDIFILSDTQILNGHVYRRGQKITFQKGDKFYNSQTDRHGNNWLDLVDDPEAQFAYFGKLIVQPDHWTDTPLGSTAGINHPGLALALAKIAQEEFERNGTPFN